LPTLMHHIRDFPQPLTVVSRPPGCVYAAAAATDLLRPPPPAMQGRNQDFFRWGLVFFWGGGFSLPFLESLPSPPLSSPLGPYLPLPPSPLPLRPFPPLPLEVRPLLRLGVLGERSSSPSGSGRSPAAKRILGRSELTVATVSMTFLRNNLPNFVHFTQ